MINHALTNNNVKIIKGDYYNHKRKHVRKKVIVFDLDETIGHFMHLQLINRCLVGILNRELFQDEFNTLLDLFPEFLRPGIITIFDFLSSKKKQTYLYKLYIYTNNQCNGEWVQKIVNYIQTKTKTPVLFDKIISAFKIQNKLVELKRTSNVKQFSDFIQCTMLPEETIETCFIDNTYYEKMCGDKIYYILPKAYFHCLRKNTMIKRMVERFMPSLVNRETLEKCLTESLSENNYISSIDEIAVTKKIMYHVREFLYYPKIPRTNKTKRNIKKPDGTRKNIARRNKI